MGNNYAILITILLSFLGININLSSQNLAPWQIEHAQLNSPYLATENSKPNPTAFDNMIGATGGKEIGNYFNPQFNSVGVINSFRSFHLMEADFGDAFFPSERVLPSIPCDCGAAIYSCPESKKCEQGNPTRNDYGFRGYKAQYCDWKNDARFQIREVYAAIETQIPIKGNYCNEVVNNECVDFNLNPCLIADGRDTMHGRKFPNKWYSFDEWGGNESAVEQNAYNYTYHFAATFCPADTSKDCVVQVLELGNEPWGALHPGRAGYHAIVRGAVQACKDLYGVDKNKWRMRLSTAAFDARFACDNAPMQYVQDMIPDDPELKKYLDFISIHNYPFIKTPCGVEVADLKLAYAPESPNGSFLALKNMDEWRRRNEMEHARINTTEVGWNSDQEDCNFGVGRANQAAYLMRANLLAARFGLHKVFNYLLIDQPKYSEKGNLISPESPLYCSTGLISREGNKKPSFYAAETFVKKLAGKHFLKAIHENYNSEEEVFAFILGDYDEQTGEGKPTHLVAWRSSDLGVSDNNNLQYPKRDSELGVALSTLTLPSANMSFNPQNTFFYLGWDNGRPQIIENSNIVQLNDVANHQAKVDLSGLPIVIPFDAGNQRYTESGELFEIPGTTSEQQMACGNLVITYRNGSIKITGQSGVNYPKMELINVTDNQYLVSTICQAGTCGSTQTIENLSEGDYLIKVFAPNWTVACATPFDRPIHLDASHSTPCEDNDGDGICETEDCDDNNPNLPKLVNAPCDDGNENTIEDKIQADGCTCQGTENNLPSDNTNSTTCGGVTIRYGNGKISLEGESGKTYSMKVQRKQGDYATVLNCHNCGDKKEKNNLTAGLYEVWVNYVSCGIINLSENSSTNSDPCADFGGDSDGDGVCDDFDCAPDLNALPKPVGTPCNDANDNTINDEIQADGCTCQGEEEDENNNSTTLSCGEIEIIYGNGQIEIIGVADKAYHFSVHDQKNEWQQIFSCWYNCASTQKIENLAPSDYLIKVYYNNNVVCNSSITLSDNLTSNALSRSVLELATNVQHQTIELEWLAGGLEQTASFIIEKSMDGIHFKNINEITDLKNYHYKAVDVFPDYGINHYRIKQLFTSGDFRYSPIHSEKYYLDEASITLFPNPVQSQLFLNLGQFNNLNGDVRIFNNLGIEVAVKQLIKDQKQMEFDLSTWQNGMYFLIIQPENQKMITRQFLIENGF